MFPFFKLRALILAGVSAAVLAACSPGENLPVSTTSQPTSTTTTSTTPIVAEGHDWIPPAVGSCDEDLASLEKVMSDHTKVEVSNEAYADAFGGLLRATLAACRTDVMQRWALEVYHPWLEGAPVTPGKVSTDISDWPPEWRESRANRASTTTSLPGDSTTTSP